MGRKWIQRVEEVKEKKELKDIRLFHKRNNSGIKSAMIRLLEKKFSEEASYYKIKW